MQFFSQTNRLVADKFGEHGYMDLAELIKIQIEVLRECINDLHKCLTFHTQELTVQ